MVNQHEIRLLEERLLQSEVRKSESSLRQLLAPSFFEFGSSGNIFDREQILRNLEQEDPAHRELIDFSVRALSPDVALATYRVRRFGQSGDLSASSLRSSVWEQQDGRWQMIFHQGTPQPVP